MTIVPVVGGFAPIGLPQYYNSGGAVNEWQQVSPNRITLRVRGSGQFLAYSRNRPVSIIANEAMVDFTFDEQTGRLEFLLSGKQSESLTINY